MQGDDNSMEQKIDKGVFDKFFTESYCPVDYTTVKEEFEQIASVGNDIFTGSYEARNLNRENFILYLTSEAYCDFEAAVQEAMDDLNPEILDAVMDVTEAQEDGDEITEVYWDTQRELLHDFLAVLRIYLAGLSFSAYCFYHKRDRYSTLIGSLIYCFNNVWAECKSADS